MTSVAESATRESPSITDELTNQLRDFLPQAFTEGRVDFDKLRAALGNLVDDRPERYTFTWAGKRDAIRLLQTPSHATLIPDRDESVNFDDTQHVFIEGDNLEVLKLLYKPYFGRVKMIYIDPPYNTGNDFIYRDNYVDPLGTYLQLTGQADAEGNLLTSNPETSGRYHSAWLSMLYARQLLREDGVIFVSIDDHEIHNLRLLMNEIFGEENFVDCVIWQKKVSPSNDAKWFSSDHDYIMVYARSKETWRPYRLKRTEKQKTYYSNPDNDSRGPWNSATYTCNKSKQQRPNLYYPITNPNTAKEIWPRETAVWKYSRDQHARHVAENRVYWGADGRARMPRLKTFLSEARAVVPRSIWPYSDVGHTQQATQQFMSFFPQGGFDSPKPTKLVERMLHLATQSHDGDLVLDFFAGSCTAAQAVLELNHKDAGNRRFVMVQLPEPTGNPEFPTIADIGKERIRRVIATMKQETAGQLSLDMRETPEDPGFKVFQLTPSNFQLWAGTDQHTPGVYAEQLSLFTDTLSDDWKPENVIYEIALKEGYDLNCTIEQMGTGHLYRVTDSDRGQSFTICLDNTLDPDMVQALELTRDDLFVCRDIALTDDLAANLALQCRLKTI
jgi:adenine-specific DNA-methyltransferase